MSNLSLKRRVRWMPMDMPEGVPAEQLLFKHFRDTLFAEDDPEPPPPPSPFRKYKHKWLDLAEDQLHEWFTDDVKQMSSALYRYRRVFAQSANGTGKSHAAARLAIAFYLIFDDAQVYLFAAPPESNLKNILWGEIGRIVEQHPKLFEGHKVSLSSMDIRRHALSFLTGVTIPVSATEDIIRSRFSGKHAPHMLFIGDESDAVPEAVFRAIEGCMSGGFSRMLALFNPKIKSGYIWNAQQKGDGKTVVLSAFSHPNVMTGEDLIPGAVSQNLTVKRINDWSRPLIDGEQYTAQEVFDVPDYLVGKTAYNEDVTEHEPDPEPAYPPLQPGLRKIIDPDMATVVLARYPVISARQLITWDMILACQERWRQYVRLSGEVFPRGMRPVSGLDVSDLGDDKNVFTHRFANGYVPKQIVWAGVDGIVTGERAAAIYKQSQCLWCNVDSTGVGATVHVTMRRKGAFNANRVMVGSKPKDDTASLFSEVPAKYLFNDDGEMVEPRHVDKKKKVVGTFDTVRSMMLWLLREWMRTDPNAMIPDDDDLAEELAAPSYSKDVLGRKIIVESTPKISKKLPDGRSPDKLMSLALTFAPAERGKSGRGGSVNYAGFTSEAYRDRGKPRRRKG